MEQPDRVIAVDHCSRKIWSQSRTFFVLWLRWRYPTTGNVIMIVSNADSQPLQAQAREALAARLSLPVETYAGLWWIS